MEQAWFILHRICSFYIMNSSQLSVSVRFQVSWSPETHGQNNQPCAMSFLRTLEKFHTVTLFHLILWGLHAFDTFLQK